MTDDDLDLLTPRLGAKVPEYKDESFLFPPELSENRHFRIKDILTNDKTKLNDELSDMNINRGRSGSLEAQLRSSSTSGSGISGAGTGIGGIGGSNNINVNLEPILHLEDLKNDDNSGDCSVPE